MADDKVEKKKADRPKKARKEVRRVTEEDVHGIVLLVEQGKSIRQISEIMNISTLSVHKWCRELEKHGVIKRPSTKSADIVKRVKERLQNERVVEAINAEDAQPL